MKKRICLLLTICMILLTAQPVMAEDFEGNESYYLSYCSSPRANAQEAAVCRRFKEYYQGKSSDINNTIDGLNSKLNSIKGNMQELSAFIDEQQGIIDTLEVQIADTEASIVTIQASIDELAIQIEQKQIDIDKRDEQIKERMVSEQPSLGTNIYMEFLMGATDIVDLMRIVEGIQRITENDQEQIQTLNKDKEELGFSKDEQGRLQESAELQKVNLEKDKEDAQSLKLQKEVAMTEYERQEADLVKQRDNAIIDANAVSDKISNIDTSVLPDYGGGGSDGSGGGSGNTGGFAWPVPAGYILNGTWYYNGGGVHLGSDFVASIGSAIVAPADGVVVARNDGCSNGWSNCGFGYVNGTGNMIHMITAMNGTTYAISFFHMNAGTPTSTGQVSAGQIIGRVGNSGWSTGPHCHVEVFNLGSMSVAQAVNKFQSYPDLAWGSGWSTPAYGTRIKPESVF